MKEKLVIALDDEGDVFEIRRASSMRHARAVADELAIEWPAFKRISICEEVDFVTWGDTTEVPVPMSP